MFSKIDSKEDFVKVVFNENYIISRTGVVTTTKLIPVPVKLIGEFETVNLDGIVYRLIDLLAIHFKELIGYIPTEQLDQVVGFVVDGDPTNKDLTNMVTQILKLEIY